MSQSDFPQEKRREPNDLTPKAASASNEVVKEKAQGLASSVSQKTQDIAANVAHKAQDLALEAAKKAQAGASAAVEKTNEGIAAVGHQMSSLGGTIRQAAPRQGTGASVASKVGDSLQAGGHYLEKHGLEDMSKDAKALIYQYPLQSLVVGFGVGCLVGMALKRS